MEFTRYVKEGFQKASEAAVDAVVSSIVANQEQHLGNLQEMQKWGIVKIIQRFTWMKYLHKEPCVVSVPETFCSVGVDPAVPSGVAFGNLEVHLSEAILLLLGNPVTAQDSSVKCYEWKVVVTCDRRRFETPTTTLLRDLTCLSEGSSRPDAPLNELHLEELVSFSNVRDLWSDICIDVMWRRLASVSDQPVSPSSAGRPDTRKEDDANRPCPWATDANPAKRKPPGVTDWEIYGRAIVPLSSFLLSYGGVTSASRESIAPISFAPPDSPPDEAFWLHLFPDFSREKKYFRPIAGYPGLGTPNPENSLGFLRVRMRFTYLCHPLLAPIRSALNAPESRWVTAMNFEPQYLETYGLRAVHHLTNLPRWVPKFFHPFTFSIRNSTDQMCIAAFWASVIYGCIFSPLQWLPSCFLVAVFSVSISYRFGRCNEPTKALNSILYRRAARRRDTELNDKSTHPDDAAVSSSSVGIVDHHHPPTTTAFLEDTEQDSSVADSHISGFMGDGGTRRMDSFLESSTNKIIPSCITEGPLAVPTTSSKPSARPVLPGTPRLAQSSSVSVVDSAFGSLALYVKDSSNYCSQFPVFAEDAGQQDIYALLEAGLKLLDLTQGFNGTFSVVVEKLKFAFNWEDPFITLTSLFAMFSLTAFITLLLALASILPACLVRLPFLFPLIGLVATTDPTICQRVWIGQCGVDPRLLWLSQFCRGGQSLVPDQQQTDTNKSSEQDTKLVEPMKLPEIPSPWQSGFMAQILPVRKTQSRELQETVQQTSSYLRSRTLRQTAASRNSPTSGRPGGRLPDNLDTRSGPFGTISVNASLLGHGHAVSSSWWQKGMGLLQRCLHYVGHTVLCFVYRVTSRVLGSFLGSILLDICKRIEMLARFIIYWWVRLPDRREIEHRQISASQYIESLDDLVPPEDTVQQPYKQQVEAYFRGLTLNRNINPLDLINMRMLRVSPEPSLSLGRLLQRGKSSGADEESVADVSENSSSDKNSHSPETERTTSQNEEKPQQFEVFKRHFSEFLNNLKVNKQL